MPRAKRSNVAFNTRGQPVNTPTGLPYGENQTLAAGQQIAPIAGPVDLGALLKQPAAPTPIRGGVGGATPEQAQQSGGQDLLSATQAYTPVPIGLTGQSNRPNEPVTAGLASGPGTGPEALQFPQGNVTQTLYALAQSTGDPIFYDLAEQASRTGQ